MPMMPTATHGPRDVWSTMKPAVGTAAQRRNAGHARAFDDALPQVEDAPAATLEAAAQPSSGTQMSPEGLSQTGDLETAPLAQESSMAPADAMLAEATLDDGSASMPAADAPVAWTGAQAADYAQQYGTPYPAAAEALTTPPPVAGPTVAAEGGDYGVLDGSASSPDAAAALAPAESVGMAVGGSPDAAAAYATAAGVPAASSQQGFSEIA